MEAIIRNSSESIPLESGYAAEIDSISKEAWHAANQRFADANIYQTWSYDSIRCGNKNISHLILRSSGLLAAGAQARLVRLPFLRLGAAYVRWGPFWRLKDQPADPVMFRMAVRALRNEYVCRRQLILRIFPLIYGEESGIYLDILREEGYEQIHDEARPRTLVLDIAAPVEDIRKKLDQKWRNCLNKAERNFLEVAEGTEDSLFANFIELYQDLIKRKKFRVPSDIHEFRMIQRDLPAEFKMRLFLCRSDSQSTGGMICTAIGETGVYLFGATNELGMKNNGSYLLQWKAIQWMKNEGCRFYNLNGINPTDNPGTYHFKAGLSGKNGKDVYYLGRFDCSPGKLQKVFLHLVEKILPRLKSAKYFLNSLWINR